MKICGIVAEYNPLHQGHIYHLNKAREITGCDLLVAVMSGNIVQRGEFAVIDKWTRARKAVEAGIDLVIELPFPFVCQSATQFGETAVKLLAMAGCDSLVFGSETNNLEELREIASMSFNIDNFRENMKEGYSYPASYGYMADSYGPNDILAISYLRALDSYPGITPYSIKRIGEYHDEDTDVVFPSARAIRKARRDGEDISRLTPLAEDLAGYPTPDWNMMYPYLRTLLLTTSPDELREMFLMDEGIENHLIKQARECDSWSQFINHATTRRYTTSRIQRTICHLLVHNTRQDMKNLPELDRIRPLAFNDKGRQYLRDLQSQGVIVANHFTQNIKNYRDLEYKVAVVYGMLMDADQRYLVVQGEVSGQHVKPRQ